MITLKQRLIEKNNKNKNGTPRRAMSTIINSSPNENISEILTRLYIHERKTIKEISIMFGIDTKTVRRYFLNLNIPKRNNYRRLILRKLKLSNEEFKNKLHTLHVIEEKTPNEIGEMYSLSHNTIRRYLREFEIPIQKSKRTINIAKRKIIPSKSLISLFPDESVKDKLYRLHHKEKISLFGISKIFHIKYATVKKYMIYFEIPITRYSGKVKVNQKNTQGKNYQKKIKSKKLLSTEERLRRQREGIRRAWKDPVKRKKRIALIHTPDAQRKRSLSLKRYYLNNPKRIDDLKKRINERTLRNINQVLGDNPKTTLNKLYTQDLLNLTEIGTLFHKEPLTIKKWLKRFNIPLRGKKSHYGRVRISNINEKLVTDAYKKGLLSKLSKKQKRIIMLRYPISKKPLTLREIGTIYGNISVERVRQIEKSALINLQKFNTIS